MTNTAATQPTTDDERESAERIATFAEARRAFNQEANDAWEHYERTGLGITNEAMKAWLKKLRAGEHPDLPEETQCRD